MLTRLEANGFKNLVDFTVDFGPFTCLAGPNAVGKSNVFDAVQFLALLTDHTLMDAALQVRGSEPETTDLSELFWTDGKERTNEFRLAVEMVVPVNVVDDFGRPAESSSTFLRYVLRVGYEAPESKAPLGRIHLIEETLDYIVEGDASKHLRFPHNAKDFRKSIVMNKRRSRNGYISTETAEDGQIEILVHQDGGSRGNPQRAPAATAPRTIVGTSNTSTTPTILAARREMQSWRILALEPSAMRGSDRFHTDPHVTASGDHLAATLYRLATLGKDKGVSEHVYSSVVERLSELVAIRSLSVVKDDVRQLLTLSVTERSGAALPARSLSDGTLRFLTLCILQLDPDATGLICMEEPENGIHPAKMNAMVKLLYDLVVDPDESPALENPVRQLIIATHSPVLVQLLRRDDLLCCLEATVMGPTMRPTTTLRCLPLHDTWRTSAGAKGVGLATILAYLTRPPGAQISLEDLNPMSADAAH